MVLDLVVESNTETYSSNEVTASDLVKYARRQLRFGNIPEARVVIDVRLPVRKRLLASKPADGYAASR